MQFRFLCKDFANYKTIQGLQNKTGSNQTDRQKPFGFENGRPQKNFCAL